MNESDYYDVPEPRESAGSLTGYLSGRDPFGPENPCDERLWAVGDPWGLRKAGE